MNNRWGPQETAQLFAQIEEVGLSSCIRAMAFVLDAGIEHLKQELEEKEPPVIESDVDSAMVKFPVVANSIGVHTNTVHKWRRKGEIAGWEQTGPKTYEMPLTEAERLERKYKFDGVNNQAGKQT